MIVYPVIHFETRRQGLENALIAFEAGADGVFVIDMSGQQEMIALSFAEYLKEKFPSKKIGINLLSMTMENSLLETVKHGLDMFWVDFPGITSHSIDPIHLDFPALLAKVPDVEFFASVAFKGQKKEKNPGVAAQIATQLGYTATTSGPGTGVPPQVEKMQIMREMLDSGFSTRKPLALASGLTPGNVLAFRPYVTHALVSTGVSHSFHWFDDKRLKLFIERANSPLDEVPYFFEGYE